MIRIKMVEKKSNKVFYFGHLHFNQEYRLLCFSGLSECEIWDDPKLFEGVTKDQMEMDYYEEFSDLEDLTEKEIKEQFVISVEFI